MFDHFFFCFSFRFFSTLSFRASNSWSLSTFFSMRQVVTRSPKLFKRLPNIWWMAVSLKFFSSSFGQYT